MRVSWFYHFGRWLTKCLLFSLTRWEVRGRENVPAEGPLLVVANHLSLADPPILGTTIPRKMLFMAKKELFRSWPTSYFIRSFGAFPVQRGAQNREAIERAITLLDAGIALAMFPEGTRSRSSRLQTAFPGSALIAIRSRAPVLPVAITGTEKLRGRGWLLRPTILVNIGRPFNLPTTISPPNKDTVQEATSAIMKAIAHLLPSNYRGAYAGEDHGTN